MARQKRTFSQRLKDAALLVLFLPFVLPLAVIAVVLHLLYKITLYLLVWMLWLPRVPDHVGARPHDYTQNPAEGQ
jgi:hypothetical protein